MRKSRERGSVAVETVLLVPALVSLVLLTAHAYRVTETAARVQRAADVAARVASQSGRGLMETRGTSAGLNELSSASNVCRVLRVTVSASGSREFNAVTAVARCTPRVSGFGFLAIRARPISRSSTEVIDFYTSR